MCGSGDTCSTLGDYLTAVSETNGAQAMMRSKLQSYFYWKAAMGKMKRSLKNDGSGTGGSGGNTHKSNGLGIHKNAGGNGAFNVPTAVGMQSAALRRKAEWQRGQAPSTKRRRTRGGGSVNVGSSGETMVKDTGANVDALVKDAGEMADL